MQSFYIQIDFLYKEVIMAMPKEFGQTASSRRTI